MCPVWKKGFDRFWALPGRVLPYCSFWPLPRPGRCRALMVVLNLVVSALSSSGRVQLLPSEVELRIFDAVDAEFPENMSEKAQRKLVGGLLCVTTHRLIWAPPIGTPKKCEEQHPKVP